MGRAYLLSTSLNAHHCQTQSEPACMALKMLHTRIQLLRRYSTLIRFHRPVAKGRLATWTKWMDKSFELRLCCTYIILAKQNPHSRARPVLRPVPITNKQEASLHEQRPIT